MSQDYPIQPVDFSKVKLLDQFWKPRLETNRTITIPYDFKKCEETHRIDNFSIAAGAKQGKFHGIRFNDSDVFKVIEGAAYSLVLHPDPNLDSYLDNLISIIAAAQESDGYLYTIRTIANNNHDNSIERSAGQSRWSYLQQSHELYNVGHMYEAAVAHYIATGKKNFLDVAIKNANLLVKTFGNQPNQIQDVPGHEEIEIGLIKLYRATKNDAYLNLAKFFLDERGHAHNRSLYTHPDCIGEMQDHIPVIEQKEAVGHSVRAGYLYAGMADIAAIEKNVDYLHAIDAIWQNVVGKKMYLTGGIGAQYHRETFGDNFYLPNFTSYNETCAAIANALWNHRMFLLHGDSKYIDILERIIFNGFLSGVSLEGDKFFYPNPLQTDGIRKFNHGAAERKPWFNTSCCPTNVARFLPSLLGYFYAIKPNQHRIYVNLYAESRVICEMPNGKIELTQKTNYPWDGHINLTINPENTSEFELYLRIPGWVLNRPVPSDLYSYLSHNQNDHEKQNESNDFLNKNSILLNGSEINNLPQENSYVILNRTWNQGDTIDLFFPMDVKLVKSHPEVKSNFEMIAFERGPLVYCAEGADNYGNVFSFQIPKNLRTENIKSEFDPTLLHGIVKLTCQANLQNIAPYLRKRHWKKMLKLTDNYRKVIPDPNPTGKIIGQANLVLIPYYAWNHRGPNEMRVWFPMR